VVQDGGVECADRDAVADARFLAAAAADAEEMRQVAIGIKATAIHALVTAANGAGVSEQRRGGARGRHPAG
jgi:hypothetical protein